MDNCMFNQWRHFTKFLGGPLSPLPLPSLPSFSPPSLFPSPFPFSPPLLSVFLPSLPLEVGAPSI